MTPSIGVMSNWSETITPRSGEEIAVGALEPYLRRQLEEGDGTFALRQFPGGRANLTYLVKFGASEYVLRRPPNGPLAQGSHDMAREHRVLSGLVDVFPLAPRSYLFCDDLSIIGAPFHVMERKHGVVIREQLPQEYCNNPSLAMKLGLRVVDALAALHAVKPEDARLERLGEPQRYLERQFAGWIKRWNVAREQDDPIVNKVIAQLSRRLPVSQGTALVHNDYKLDNLIFSKNEKADIIAILDWDMCTRGDPLTDLGTLLAYWVEPTDRPEWIGAAMTPTWQPGFPSRADLVHRYCSVCPTDAADIGWYHLFAVFKLIVITQQLHIRYVHGYSPDTRYCRLVRPYQGAGGPCGRCHGG